MSRRILLVARGLDAVGTGREVLLTAHDLLEAGDDLHMAVITKPSSVATEVAARQGVIHALSHRPQPDAASVAELARTIRRLQPHLVATWGWSAWRTAGAALATMNDTRAPRWLGSLGSPVPPSTPTARWFTRRLMHRCDLLLAATEATVSTCRTLGAQASRVRLCPPGVAEPPPARLSREEVASRFGLPQGDTWTLCVAPLVARSRLARLVWAADQLDVVLHGLTHVLVGAGPLASQIARRARAQQAAARIRMLPACEAIRDLLAHVRLVWQPGEVAYGGALLDALAAGVPAVAVAGDAAETLIERGVTGQIVPADPPSEFPRHALPILEDDELHHRFADASRRRARTAFARTTTWHIQRTAICDLIG